MIVFTVLLLTVTSAVLDTSLFGDFAVIVLVPSAMAVTSPALLMVAMLGAEEVHVTCEVASPLELFPYVAVAVNCCVCCGWMYAPVGDRESETIVPDDGKKPLQLLRKTAAAIAAITETMNRFVFIILLLPVACGHSARIAASCGCAGS